MKKLIVLTGLAGILSMSANVSAASAKAPATTLIKVYQQASQNDPAFLTAQGIYQKVKANVPLATAVLLPIISLATTWGKNIAPSSTVPSATSNVFTSGFDLSLKQSIFNWSNIQTLRAASAAAQAAYSAYSASIQGLMLMTMTNYLSVVQAAATVDYDKADTKSLYTMYQENLQKYRAGLIAISDVYSTKADYETQMTVEIQDKNKLDNAIETLKAQTNSNYSSINGLSHGLETASPQPANMNTWVQKAQQQNLTLLADRALVKAAHLTVSADFGGHLPSLALNGDYSRANIMSSATKVAGHTDIKNANLALTIPIFSGGAVSAQSNVDAAALEIAQAQLDTDMRGTTSTTRQYYLNVLADISAIKSSKLAYISANETYKASRAQYQAGTQIISVVLTDLTKRTLAQKSILDSQVKYLTDLITLKQATGLLKTQDIKYISSLLTTRINLPNTLHRTQYSFASTTNINAKKKIKAKTPRRHTKKPAKQTTKSHRSGYGIQVFSSTKQTEAKRYLSRHLKAHKESYIAAKNHAGSKYYTVMLGHYKTKRLAQAAMRQLAGALQKQKPWIRYIK